MTSVQAVGYTSQARSMTGSRFDPLNQAAKGPAPPLQKKVDNSPEEQHKELERKVHQLLEESSSASLAGDFSLALEKAKEAAKRERVLCKQREQANMGDQISIDLTYAVSFNLAHQYHTNGLYTEALNTFSQIVKNKQFGQAGRLRVNMGNIYYKQKKFPQAIKMYRMALDQIPSNGKATRYKIMRNIANCFIRMGQYQDAVHSFETIMEGSGDHQAGYNLVICYFALGDKEKLKKAFVKLLAVPTLEEDEEDDLDTGAEAVLQNDGLKEEMKVRQKQALKYISVVALLIAPIIDKVPC
ncbi:hypothetical protein CBR_g44618 [Chara braunii]|uniref:Uncharacterized protein n=1 Tax=Chara braunii TaxID=69332 RepID=A0A388LXV4_CHABU|nr:hypothetical protein CBR_g44618 [Chara braunii]|eukprot:GBG87160.1 hypothetical protein CBR_g44618 [Chara braunii]